VSQYHRYCIPELVEPSGTTPSRYCTSGTIEQSNLASSGLPPPSAPLLAPPLPRKPHPSRPSAQIHGKHPGPAPEAYPATAETNNERPNPKEGFPEEDHVFEGSSSGIEAGRMIGVGMTYGDMDEDGLNDRPLPDTTPIAHHPSFLNQSPSR
jgi:hypothetical protein